MQPAFRREEQAAYFVGCMYIINACLLAAVVLYHVRATWRTLAPDAKHSMRPSSRLQGPQLVFSLTSILTYLSYAIVHILVLGWVPRPCLPLGL
jgi:hypothetical protein